ncbi:hypothetical protein [Acinetobacter gyllenbergii]|uniref:hypothetical protein n=1 Tax=Acinetobacter gyllenbergii TaxID=134534 RepID=UPI000806A3D5|nr:hypothetical protein [Acinetobacter gyllenbergii]OBY76078.1 hypothetical protein NG55_05290 [Acinetobacter gyllenbergii]
MKTWDQVLESAIEFVAFLEKGNFYSSEFNTENDYKIIHDANLGIDYATNDSFDDFDEWETVTDSMNIFPESFEWSDRIKYKLKKNNFFGFEAQQFNGAKEKWMCGEACLIVELMKRDIGIIFQCYANDHFPNIWKEILSVYLNGGFPCGWDGHYPEGRLVVFSNE